MERRGGVVTEGGVPLLRSILDRRFGRWCHRSERCRIGRPGVPGLGPHHDFGSPLRDRLLLGNDPEAERGEGEFSYPHVDDGHGDREDHDEKRYRRRERQDGQDEAEREPEDVEEQMSGFRRSAAVRVLNERFSEGEGQQFRQLEERRADRDADHRNVEQRPEEQEKEGLGPSEENEPD